MSKLFAPDILADLRELNTSEDPQFFKEFMLLFLKTAPLRIEEIRQACARRDGVVLNREAHALKSSCSSVGAIQLTELCSQLEQLGKKAQFETADLKFNELADEFEIIKAAILALPEMA